MTALPRRLAVLFLLAATGALAVVGVVVGELAGPLGVLVYAAAVLALTGWAALRVRRSLTAAAARPAAQRCTCCDGDHTAPVRVV